MLPKIIRASACIKIAQKPYIIGSLGPKALKYESFEGKASSDGQVHVQLNDRGTETLLGEKQVSFIWGLGFRFRGLAFRV